MQTVWVIMWYNIYAGKTVIDSIWFSESLAQQRSRKLITANIIEKHNISDSSQA